jgi:preprotein translocase subunit SecE
MARDTEDKDREADEGGGEDEESSAPLAQPRGGGELMKAADEDEGAEGSEREDDGQAEGDEGETDGEENAAAQLGTDRYVLAGFFAAGMAGAYVLGRAIEGAWATASNKDWFIQNFPRLVAIDDKSTYGIIIGGIISLIVVARSYRRPDVRTWADEVAAELQKVVWPTRKDVYNSTFIVIVASTVATIYLALLDRLWAFVTNIVYGDGS